MPPENGSASHGTTAYLVTSGSYSDYQVNRVYLDEAEAKAFVEAYNRTSSYSEYDIEEFQIGAPPAQMDGPIWEGTWNESRVEKDVQSVVMIGTDGSATVFPNAKIKNATFYAYAYREHFHRDYVEPPQWTESFTYREVWHTGETPPKAEVTLTRGMESGWGNGAMVTVRGTSKDHVEKSLQDAAAQMKAKRAGLT